MRLHKPHYFLIIFSLLLAMLTGCSEIEPTTDPIDPPDPTIPTVPTGSVRFLLLNCNGQGELTLAEMVGQCPQATQFSSSIPATLHITVLDADSEAISGQIVTFATTIGTIPGLTNGRTDENGMASQTISFAPENDGAGKTTATFDDGSSTSPITFTVTPNSQPPSSATIDVRLYDCSNQASDISNVQIPTLCTPAIEISSIKPGVLLSSLSTPTGTPIVGEIIIFAATAGKIPPLSNGLTDSNGMSSQTITVDAGISGAGVISAASLGVSDNVNFAIKATVVDAENATLNFALYDCFGFGSVAAADIPTTCVASNNVSFSRPATLYAQLLDSNRAPVANEIIDFSSTIGAIPGQQNGLTDSNGMTAQVLTVSTEDSGAGVITATSLSVSDKVNFGIGDSNLIMTITSGLDGDNDPSTPDDNLAIGTSTVITVAISDTDGNAISTPFIVGFTSSCASAGKSELDTAVTSSNGVAQATYETKSCSDEDTITATTTLANLTGSVTLNIDTAPANSIKFVSAEPEQIMIQGSGGAESSILTFQILDGLNNPVAQQEVSFELISNTPGVANIQATAKSNSNGEVKTTVTSGFTPAVVQVKASFLHPDKPGTIISTRSNNLVISTGFADNDGLSISMDMHNPESWGIDGILVTVTARLNDHKNNPVPDGTAVNFETEGATIEPSCTTSNGVCSVAWTSQNPRTSNGRITVLAYAVGEESFSDVKPSDGLYTPEDYWPKTLGYPQLGIENDIAEAFRDDNETGLFDIEEEFTDSNGNGVWDSERYIDRNRNGKYDLAEVLTNDRNGNGRYDAAERYRDLNGNGIWNPAEAFTDTNGNDQWDTGEPFIDSNLNSQYDYFEPLLETNVADGMWTDADVFTDANDLNGYYDPKEILFDSNSNDLQDEEAYTDANSNGRYDFAEEFHDFNSDGLRSAANGIFNGTLCAPVAEAAGTCTKETLYIYRNSTMVMASSDVIITLYNSDGSPATLPIDLRIGSVDLFAIIQDINGNTPPGNSTIAVTGDNAKVLAASTNKVATTNLSPVPVSFSVDSPDEPKKPDGKVIVSLTTPGGFKTSASYSVIVF